MPDRPDMTAPDERLIDEICAGDPVTVAAALQAAAPHREALAPVLLARLMQAAFEPQKWTGAEGQPCPVFLPYLAAEWRLTGAHPLLVGLLRLPPDDCNAVLGDFITEGARRTLADTWPGDLRAIEALALDTKAESYARSAALDAAVLLAARGSITRAAVIDLLARCAALPCETGDNDEFCTVLVGTAVEFRAWELRGTIATLFERGLVDPGYYGDEEEVLPQLGPGSLPDFSDAYLFPPPITSAWEAVRGWCFFDEQHPGRKEERLRELEQMEDSLLDAPEDADLRAEPMTYRRESPKVGRNDPCPCGSGKKFKKCCGA